MLLAPQRARLPDLQMRCDDHSALQFYMIEIISKPRSRVDKSGRRACPRSLLFLILLLTYSTFPQVKDFTRWVNPFIGTGGHGHTFPGATVPFGMVQLSPDTRIDNWDGSSGYHYSDNLIYGFSHTHLSGTGIPDGADILFMPTVGSTSIMGPSEFSHTSERADPGYYSVKLDQSNVVAELTATTRVGMHQYSFPKTNEANVALDLGWRDKVIDSEVKTI